MGGLFLGTCTHIQTHRHTYTDRNAHTHTQLKHRILITWQPVCVCVCAYCVCVCVCMCAHCVCLCVRIPAFVMSASPLPPLPPSSSLSQPYKSGSGAPPSCCVLAPAAPAVPATLGPAVPAAPVAGWAAPAGEVGSLRLARELVRDRTHPCKRDWTCIDAHTEHVCLHVYVCVCVAGP